MSQHLVLSIRFHEARYHGTFEWPPAPARLFQALLSGAAQGMSIPEEAQRALQWIEHQPPPVVAAPHAREGQRIFSFVPNNDADSLGGDLSLVEKIRTQKLIVPWLISTPEPLVYAWTLEHSTVAFDDIEATAHKLYQLGRGVDMAWADVRVMSEEAFAELLTAFRGAVHRPTPGGGGNALACPVPGSLQSLLERQQAMTRRLRTEGSGRNVTHLFVQPPKPRFSHVSYDSRCPSRVFQLVHSGTDKLHAWRLSEVVHLVERIRGAAAQRLQEALPDRAADVRASLIGKRPEEVNSLPTTQRVRIVPLPSIGHEHADYAIRRVLVEVPNGCPLPPEDVFWSFSGQVFDAVTGEVDSVTLVPAETDSMRAHYERPALRFRSVTAAALPLSARRRRIDPAHMEAERKPASERIEEERRAVSAVRTALRHAGVRVPAVGINVQREPFGGKGVRAEWFSGSTRFEKERLWHVELEFEAPVHGLLAIGDGRFLGLGVLEPQGGNDGIYAFAIERGLARDADPIELARALRRAVMSRVQLQLGRGVMPAYFSGHDANGDVAKTEIEPHIAVQFDGCGRLFVIAPHVASRRNANKAEVKHLALLDRALYGLVELRAGKAGVLPLRALRLDANEDHLFAPAREWVSLTPYTLERHPKRNRLPSEAAADEIRSGCHKQGLPEPGVEVRSISGIAGSGVQCMVRLAFPVAVRGPLLLGRTRHLGGGLFGAVRGDWQLTSDPVRHA